MKQGKFRKRPVVIDAIQWDGTNWADVAAFLGIEEGVTAETETRQLGYRTPGPGDEPDAVIIPTLEGDMRADAGWWIIRGLANEYYPCRPDVFASSYEPVD